MQSAEKASDINLKQTARDTHNKDPSFSADNASGLHNNFTCKI